MVRAGVSEEQLIKAREKTKPKPIEVLPDNLLTVQVFTLLDLKVDVTMGGAIYSGTNKSEALAVVKTFTKDDKIIRDTLVRLKIIESEACKILNQRQKRGR